MIKLNIFKDEEILPSNQNTVIEQAKFTCSPVSKTFEKQIKTIEDQGETKIKAAEEHGKQLVKLIKSNVC